MTLASVGEVLAIYMGIGIVTTAAFSAVLWLQSRPNSTTPDESLADSAPGIDSREAGGRRAPKIYVLPYPRPSDACCERCHYPTSDVGILYRTVQNLRGVPADRYLCVDCRDFEVGRPKLTLIDGDLSKMEIAAPRVLRFRPRERRGLVS